MKSRFYTHEQLINVAQLKPEDIGQIRRRRRQHNRLGFGYQLCFVRLTNRFPTQQPFEIYEDILSFASVQLGIPADVIDTYASCMTLILASIIYWQAKEINRVVLECDPEGAGVDLSLIQHISPITWDNVILYGKYMLDRNLVKI